MGDGGGGSANCNGETVSVKGIDVNIVISGSSTCCSGRAFYSGAGYSNVVLKAPTTGTNKIVKRTLVREKFWSDLVGGDEVYVRLRGEDVYRPFTAADERALHESFVHYQRDRFWDL